jgi:hypothetical protein
VTEAPPRRVAISQKKFFEKVGFVPHPGQRKILSCGSRFVVTSAGRRFGKSVIGGNRLALHAFESYFRRSELEDRGIRAEYWITGPNYSDSEKEFRVLWNTLTKQQVPFDRPGTYNDPLGGNMHISLWGGLFQVHAKSAAHPESLVGEGLHGVIMAEAAKIKETVWTKSIRPTLNDFGGWAMFTSTPEGKNWFYDLWQRGQDPNQEAWDSFRMPAWVNPHVYPKGATDLQIAMMRRMLNERMPITGRVIDDVGIDPEVAQSMMDLTDTTFGQEIAADFTDFVGRVFKDFDEEIHVGDFPFEHSWSTWAVVDYGFTNPNVWLLIQVDPFGERIRVLDEVYESGLTAVDFAHEIQRKGLCPPEVAAFYPDPASPGDTRILESILKVRGRGGTGGELNQRLDAIRLALRPWPAHDPKARPRIMFDRRCTRTIQDFLNYRYPDRRDQQDKNSPENPLKKDDHGPEALGRFYAGHFGTVAKQARRARVRSASMTG